MIRFLRYPTVLASLCLAIGTTPLCAEETADPAAPATMWEMIEKSGFSGVLFLVALGIFSLVAVAFILERLVNLTRGKVLPAAFLAEMGGLARKRVGAVEPFRDLCDGRLLTESGLDELRIEGAPPEVLDKIKFLTQEDSARSRAELSQVIEKALAPDERLRWADRIIENANCVPRRTAPIVNVLRASLLRAGRPVPEVEKAMEDALGREVASMKSSIRPLTIIGAVAPLLGLLGTVVGMIIAFRMASVQGLGKAELLAEGIYLALLTTAAGLSIAIPCVLCAAFFNNRIDKFMREMDERLMDTIPCFARMEKSARERRADIDKMDGDSGVGTLQPQLSGQPVG